MSTFPALLWLGLAWLAVFARTYGIDSSCEDVDFIQASADAAIDMAQAALDELNEPTLDPNVDRLLGLLFRPADTASGPNDDVIIEKMRFVYRGVTRFKDRTDLVQAGYGSDRQLQVNIYCNLNRFEKRSSDGQWQDTVTDMILKDFTDADVNQCKTLDGTLAITWTPRHYLDPTVGLKYSPGQVNLCPWFYKLARSKALKSWKALGVKSFFAKGTIPVTTRGWPFTPIDAITLLDKVLLHEFTHTMSCGNLDDVVMATGGAPGFKGKAYGWNSATTLARQKDNDDINNAGNRNEDDPIKSPLRNSDSFALFASGVRLLSKTPPLYIKDNGWVTAEQQQTRSKRDIPVELRYKQTPAAFEGFITSIRAERAATATAVEIR